MPNHDEPSNMAQEGNDGLVMQAVTSSRSHHKGRDGVLQEQDLDQLCHAIKQPSDGLATAVCNVVQPQYHGLEGGEALLGSKHSLMNTAASNTTMLQDYFNSGEISSAKVVLPSRQKDALQVQDKARVCGREKAMYGRVGVVGLLCMYTQASVHTSIRACTQKYRQKDGNAHRFQHRTHTQREHTHAQAQQIKEEQEPPRELAACSALALTEAYWQGELPRLQSYVHTHMNIR